MIYAMSDIHGQYELMEKRIEQLKPLLSEIISTEGTKAMSVLN